VVRDEISQYFLETFFERVAEALRADTFDADPDRHLSWKPVVIDRRAWKDLGDTLDEVLEWLPELEADPFSARKMSMP
jgi:hypothetical protein